MNAEYLGRRKVDPRGEEVVVGWAEDLEREYSVWIKEDSFGLGAIEVTVRSSEGDTYSFTPESRLGVHGSGQNASVTYGEERPLMPEDDEGIEAVVRALKAKQNL